MGEAWIKANENLNGKILVLTEFDGMEQRLCS
jgi:hypothetical protein